MGRREKIAGTIALVALALIGLYMIAVAINVIGRHGFRAPLMIISDMGEFLVPTALALAFPVAALGGSHLQIKFLGGIAGPGISRLLEMLARLATVFLLGLIAWRLCDYTFYLARSGRASTLGNIPVWPVWAFVTLAFGASVIATLFAPLDEPPAARRAADAAE